MNGKTITVTDAHGRQVRLAAMRQALQEICGDYESGTAAHDIAHKALDDAYGELEA